jgi:hypothetical protein
MRLRVMAWRAPIVLALALALTAVAVRSSLAQLLPFDITSLPGVGWLFLAILAALVPALAARTTPLPAAAVVTVPVLVAASYGASRLDWLRVLKDFGVAEPGALDPVRLALAVLALALLWTLHAADMAMRFRLRAVERGIDEAQARAAASRTVRRNAQAGALAIAGALGLLLVGILGLQVSAWIPTERAALAAPLVAAAALVAAALYLARGARDDSADKR